MALAHRMLDVGGLVLVLDVWLNNGDAVFTLHDSITTGAIDPYTVLDAGGLDMDDDVDIVIQGPSLECRIFVNRQRSPVAEEDLYEVAVTTRGRKRASPDEVTSTVESKILRQMSQFRFGFSPRRSMPVYSPPPG